MKIESGILKAPSNLTDLARQAEWREHNVEKIKASRKWRLEVLSKERVAIRRAADAYEALDRGDVPRITLRSQFIRLDAARRVVADEAEMLEPEELSSTAQQRARRRELASRPPLTRLVHRQSNALAVYLTAIYVAHMETRAGQAFVNRRHNTRSTPDGAKSWSVIAGLSAPKDPRSRRARVRRALDELVVAGIASIHAPGARHRYEDWLLLKEDGSDSMYRVPSERERDATRLPAAFFLNGWHLVLLPGELAMLLAIMDMARRVGRPAGPGTETWVALPRSVRDGLYGLTGEMYLHAQQLHEFGLVNFRDPMPTRRRGKIPVDRTETTTPPEVGEDGATSRAAGEPKPPPPYQFAPSQPAVFDHDALTVIHETLAASPTSHRLTNFSDIVPPPQWAKLNSHVTH